MYQVLEEKDADRALDHYRSEYKNKFRTFPVDAPLGSNRTYCLGLIKQFRTTGHGDALNKAKQIITHFLSMPEEWFVKQGYSLECLTNPKTLPKVNMSWGQTQELTSTGTVLQLNANAHCDECKDWFQISCDSNHIGITADNVPKTPDNAGLSRVLCPECMEILKAKQMPDRSKGEIMWP